MIGIDWMPTRNTMAGIENSAIVTAYEITPPGQSWRTNLKSIYELFKVLRKGADKNSQED